MIFSSFPKLVISYIILVAVVLLVLLSTFLNFRSQKKQLGQIQISREVLQKLEPSVVNINDFVFALTNYIQSEDQSKSNFFEQGILQIRNDSMQLVEIDNSDTAQQNKKDFQKLTTLQHELMSTAAFILYIKENKGFAAAKAELNRNEASKISSEFKTIAERVESHSRIVLNNAYGGSIKLTRKTFVFTGIIAALLIVILIISFFVSYKDIRNRILYNQELEKQVKEKTVEISNVFERVTDAFIALDKEWRYTYLNEKACEMHGKKAEDLIGKNIWAEFPDVINEPLYKAMHNAMEIQKPLRLELYYSTTGKWFEDLIYPSPDGVSVYYHDITEKKKAEIKLAESEEKFRTIIEQASDGIFVADQNSFIIDANENGCSMMGYTKEELRKIKFGELVALENLKNDPIRYKELNSGNAVLIERRLIRKDGSEIEVEISAKKLSDGRYQSIVRDITDRKRIEAELRKSEERYRSVIEQASDAIMITDTTGNFIDVNTSFCKLFDYSKEELLGMNVSLVIDPEQLKTEPIRFDLLMAGQTIFRERRMLHKNGTIIEVEANVKMLPDGRVMAIARDITDRKKTDDILINNELRFRTLAGNAPVGIFQTDANGKTTYVNETWMDYTGMKFDEAMGDGWIEAVHPDDREILKKGWYDKAQLGLESTSEYRLIHKNGTVKWVSGKAVPIFNNSGEITGYIGTLSDFTERKKAEVELLQSESKFRSLINAAPDATVIVNEKGIIQIINYQTEILFGYKKNELVGLSVEMLIPETLKEKDIAERSTFLSYSKTEMGIGRELIALKKDGTKIPVEISLSPFHSDEGLLITASVRDITERKLAEAAVKESEEKYRTLVDQAGDAIAMFDRSGKFIDVNPSATQLLQYTRREFANMSLKDIFYKDELEKQPLQFDVLESGESTIKHRQLKRKDGSPVDSEVHTRMLHDGRFLSVVRDLTERNRARMQIEKERNLSDSVINSLPGVFFLQDRSGKFLRWNKEFEVVSGYNNKEISNLKPTVFYEEKEKATIIKKIEEVFANGSGDIEIMIINKHGKKIPFYFTAQLIQYEGMPCLIGTGIDITEQKKAQEELERSYKAIRQLTEHLQNIREEERINIAREIHDELGQQLTVLKMDISWLKKKLAKTDTEAVEKVNDLLKLTDTTIKSVRKISSELRPSLLDDLGLMAAIEWQLKEFESRSSIKTSFTATETESDFPDSIKTALFRIFQESLTNVARHAKASNVKVSLEYKNNNFVLNIKDDGKGFHKHKIADKRTLGLLGMKERTAMIGGAYDIISAPGKGTTIIVTVPLGDNNQVAKA